MKDYPFLIGAQYYRAPTPEQDCWQDDLRRMRELGFNCVKYWVQWRWSHRSAERFVFSDLDKLMDLAHDNGLAVHLNVIFDTAPVWLFKQYPEAMQLDARGIAVQPRSLAHRQIGGAPGPCFSHEGALLERKRFLSATVEHFRHHPALAMWDVWNEPELSYPVRTPMSLQDGGNFLCYCPACHRNFHAWLQRKYASLDALNQAWGRCYENWEEVEQPVCEDTFLDFTDWREFHLDTLTAEADWRLQIASQLDPAHTHYLHTVPNTLRIFNSVSCVDDHEIMRNSEVYASSGNSLPMQMTQSLSVASGKIMYNVESHINGGMTHIHRKDNQLCDLLHDWLPQIGMGFRGFMFWQYRPEILGREAPAWGLVNLDGSDSAITRALQTFAEKLRPHEQALLAQPAPSPQIGVWNSRKNEIFHYAQHKGLSSLADSIENYIDLLYWDNYPARFISGAALERGELDGIRLLILPSCYYMTQAECDSIRQWVNNGGILLAEAHLAGYSATSGRHERVLPGGGLAEAFGLREAHTTSSYHLHIGGTEEESQLHNISDDLKKELKANRLKGQKYFPIAAENGDILWGAERFAVLEGEALTVEGRFQGKVCIASKPVGKGMLFYAGTNLGEGSAHEPDGLRQFLRRILDKAGIRPTLNASGTNGTVHADALSAQIAPQFIILTNKSEDAQSITLHNDGLYHGIFSARTLDFSGGVSEIRLDPRFSDIFVRTALPC